MDVKTVYRIVSPELEIPNGTYNGIFMGHEVHFQTAFAQYMIEVSSGVRGQVAVTVTVDNGKFVIERIHSKEEF